MGEGVGLGMRLGETGWGPGLQQSGAPPRATLPKAGLGKLSVKGLLTFFFFFAF